MLMKQWLSVSQVPGCCSKGQSASMCPEEGREKRLIKQQNMMCTNGLCQWVTQNSHKHSSTTLLHKQQLSHAARHSTMRGQYREQIASQLIVLCARGHKMHAHMLTLLLAHISYHLRDIPSTHIVKHKSHHSKQDYLWHRCVWRALRSTVSNLYYNVLDTDTLPSMCAVDDNHIFVTRDSCHRTQLSPTMHLFHH
jgi:hypothetical protein